MPPEIAVNYLAVIACVVAAMPVGFLWFGPLFGKAWAKAMGMEDVKPDGADMAKSMIIYAVGNLLIAFVLAHSLAIWRPSTWGAGQDVGAYIYALNVALWAVFVGEMRAWLASPRVLKAMNRIGGSFLIGAGALTAVVGRTS